MPASSCIKPILYFLLIVCPGYLQAQMIDTPNLKQLKNLLPKSKGENRIKSLIQICHEYYGLGFFNANDHRIDSLELYANTAKREAEKSKYEAGIIEATVYTAFVKLNKNDIAGAEKDLKKAISSHAINDNMAGLAHGLLGSITIEKFNDPKGITYFNTALKHFTRSKNIQEISLTHTRLAMSYLMHSDYENAVIHCSKAIELSKAILVSGQYNEWIKYLVLQPLSMITDLYRLAGDIKTAKEYLYEKIRLAEKLSMPTDDAATWAKLYYEEGKYDSTIYYLNKLHQKYPSDMLYVIEKGKTHLKASEFSTSLTYLQVAIDTFRNRMNNPTRPRAKLNLLENLIAAAKAHYHLKNYTQSSELAKEGLQLLKENKNKFLPIQQYQLFADAYQFSAKSDSALFYFQKHGDLKDSLLGKQFMFQLNNLKRTVENERHFAEINLLQTANRLKEEQLKQEALLKEQKEAQLTLLDKDNKLKHQQLLQESFIRAEKESRIQMLHNENELKEHKLKQEAFFNKVMIAGFSIILVLGIFLVRLLSLRRKNEKLKRERAESELKLHALLHEKKQAEFQQQAAELEMQALRAQMNPHFIFNCLSSINWLILENNPESASDYLTRFSRLIRLVLINSEKSVITLDEEVKMLELYLDMERLRFENAFEYFIHIDKGIPTESTYVPPLLLQPFCENAIWHGLMHKDDHGQLEIKIQQHNDIIYCTVTDNGVGRIKAAMYATNKNKNHQSRGLKITENRIALFNQKKGAKTFYEIEDLIDQEGKPVGTRVMIKIKHRPSKSENILDKHESTDHR